MRRGCLTGCLGMLVVCVIVSLLGWFVVIPRVSDAVSDSVANGISTIVSDEIDPQYTRSELQNGAEVEFSFATINRELAVTNEDEAVQDIVITSEGNTIIIRASIETQTYDVEFQPRVVDGRLELEHIDDGGWLQRQFMGILSGGFEKSINSWLEANGLRLQDVTVSGDSLILFVIGE